MQVIEGTHKLNLVRQKHTVTKHIAGHVADTDNREFIFLDVDSDLAEVALYRYPSALRRNPHGFMVIAVAAPRGKGIA